MTSEQRQALLDTRTLPAFLRLIHAGATHQAVRDLLRPHGGPKSRQAIADYIARESMPPKSQRAYAVAYGYVDDHALRVHMQDLIVGAVPALEAEVEADTDTDTDTEAA